MRIWYCPSCGQGEEFPDEDEEVTQMFCTRCRKYVKPKKGRIF